MTGIFRTSELTSYNPPGQAKGGGTGAGTGDMFAHVRIMFAHDAHMFAHDAHMFTQFFAKYGKTCRTHFLINNRVRATGKSNTPLKLLPVALPVAIEV